LTWLMFKASASRLSWRDVSQEMFFSPLNLRISDARMLPISQI